MRGLLRFMLAYELFYLTVSELPTPRQALLYGPLAQIGECSGRRWRLLELAG